MTVWQEFNAKMEESNRLEVMQSLIDWTIALQSKLEAHDNVMIDELQWKSKKIEVPQTSSGLS